MGEQIEKLDGSPQGRKDRTMETEADRLSGLEWNDLFLTVQEAPRCLCCERPNDGTISIRRENSAYCDEVDNWLISCRDCFDKRDEYWAEAWEDYYSMAR